MTYAGVDVRRTGEAPPPFRISSDCLRHKGGMHFHNYTQICHVLSGTLDHTIQNKKYFQTHGTSAIIFPYTRHCTDSLNSEDTPIAVFIRFDEKFMIEHGKSFFLNDSRYTFEGRNLPVFRNFNEEESIRADKIIRDLLNEYSLKMKISYGRIAEQLASYLRIYSTESIETNCETIVSTHTAAITAATEYIANHFAEKISIKQLCYVATMSRSSFTYAFKVITGMTVAQFINSVRIHEARRLVAFSNESFVDIAKNTGFYDGAHLSNTFTSHYGISPREFREMAQKNPKLLELHFSYVHRKNLMKSNELV